MNNKGRDLRSEIVDLEIDLGIMCSHYDRLRKEFCTNCRAGLCSEHQSSIGIINFLKRNRHD